MAAGRLPLIKLVEHEIASAVYAVHTIDDVGLTCFCLVWLYTLAGRDKLSDGPCAECAPYMSFASLQSVPRMYFASLQ